MRTSFLFTRQTVSLLAIIFVAAALGSINEATAQSTKRPLNHTDFDSWRSIATPTISRDGKWLAYAVQPQQGDGEVVIRELATGKERREGVGTLPPPATTPNEENPDAPPVPRVIRIAFTSDSRFVVTTTYPTKAETVAARKAKRRPEEMPKGGLLMVNLGSPEALRVANVKSMLVPAKGGAWVAYVKEAEPAKADETNKPAVPPTGAIVLSSSDALVEVDLDQAARRPAPTAAAAAATSSPRKEYGTELVLRDLAAGTERTFANVLEYAFARDGKTLLFTVSSKAETDNGVYTLSPQQNNAPTALLSGKGKYTKLVWDREQSQLAFLSDRDDIAAKVPQFKMYYWLRNTSAAAEIVSSATPAFPSGMTISDKGAIAFSRDGKKLYVPAAPPAKAPKSPDAMLAEEDRVTADLWRWNDDLVQPMQKVRAVQDRNRSYRGVMDLASKRYVQLATETMRNVSLSDDGTRAVGSDDRAHRRLIDFDGNYSDFYVVDTNTGGRKLALSKQRDNGNLTAAQWSPDGTWVLQYQAKHWHLLNTTSGVRKNLTASIKSAFFNEQHDAPSPAAPYGTAGWTSDSASVLLYDRFDVWQVFVAGRVAGRAAVNLTTGEGRRSNTRLRVQPIEPVDEDDDERGIDTKKPLTLRGESEATRATGFFRTTFGATTAPRRLLWGDYNARFVTRSQDADVLITTASRFDTFPELQVSDTSFTNPKKASDVGAQMVGFAWGSSELMSFKNAKGVPLQAALYKPANFDAKRKYPLMVYIYERLSQDVHGFVNPAPGQNINRSLYTSNGYVVLMPDISYTTGYPGKSALDAVLPAIDTLVKQGFIDEKAIGIQGHSWGGYQIAWMVTQTNRFRAAEAGAPVGNMTSAYSGIRWGSGLPRQFQYEQQQSRIGKSLQEATPLYLANSPVFHIQKVKTPLLILHNDADDAVPWLQGIELFLAMRRYDKEAYFFNYNGALHGLRRRADLKDFGLRMQQYFDHFLKGAPKPEWMEKGIPFNEREEEKERFGKVVAADATKQAL
jgi:dipeptidyl aminopeptidase/acylaminoacyl peptidase